MKVVAKQGSRLALTVLMVIIGTSTAFAAVDPLKDKKDVKGSAHAVNERTEKDAKGEGTTKEGTKELSDSAQDAKATIKAATSTPAPARTAGDPMIKAQVLVITKYLDAAQSVAGVGDAVVAKAAADTRTAINDIKRDVNPANLLVKRDFLAAISKYTQYLTEHGQSTGKAYSPLSVELIRDMAQGFAIHIPDSVTSQQLGQETKFKAQLKLAADKSPDKTIDPVGDFDRATMSDVTDAVLKLAADELLKNDEVQSGQVNSDAALAQKMKVVKNVQKIMASFKDKMASKTYATAKLAMLSAVMEWAKENKVDGAKAASCLFNKLSA